MNSSAISSFKSSNKNISKRQKNWSISFVPGVTSDSSVINSTLKYVQSENQANPKEKEIQIRKDVYGTEICKGSKMHKVSFRDNVSHHYLVELILFNVEKAEPKANASCSGNLSCLLF